MTYEPVTEEQWKAEHVDAPSALEYDPPRPVIVMWHDATETPSECIARLNAEVLEQAGRKPRPVGHRDDPATSVRALAAAVTRMDAALDGDTEYFPALVELATAVQNELVAMARDYLEANI